MAVPNPQDELTRLERLLAKGLPPVVLVTGPSDFFRAAAVDRLLTAVPPDAELRTVDAVEERAGGGGGGGGEDRARWSPMVVLEVADRGPGLPAGLAEQFADAASGSRATTSLPLPSFSEGGRGGLGLAIVRQLAVACGGSFELRDRAGGGASARLILPAFRPGEADAEGTPE